MRAEVAWYIGLNALPPNQQKEKEIVDWGEAFTTLIAHTSIRYFDVPEMTLLQINTILGKIGRHISLKIGLPFVNVDKETEPEKEHSVEDAINFVGLFAGL